MRRETALALWLAGGFAACALFSVTLTRDTNSIAALWLANGLLAAGFVLLPRGHVIALALACAALSLTINLLTGAGLPASPIFTALNITEAALAAWITRRLCGPRMRIRNLAALLKVTVLAVLPAAAATAVLTGLAFGPLGRPFDAVAFGWFAAHALGMAITLPAVLLIVDGKNRRDFQRSAPRQLAIYSSVALISAVAYLPSTFPTPLLVTPVLVVAAFQLGPRGAALSAIMMALISTAVVTIAPREGIAAAWTQTEHIHNLQVVIAAAFMTSLSVALILAEQARFRQMLALRTRAARHAQARAQAAGAAKAEFLATMSHEIRTPMNSILGFTQTLLRRDDLPPEVRRQMNLIHRASGSLMAVVNDILDFSKLDAGEVELAPRPIPARLIADDAAEIIAPSAAAKGLALEVEAHGPVDDAVLADDLRLRQVLLNLLSNSVKFTETGKIVLRLTARDQGEDLLLRFEVRDTGVGIPKARMHRLFHRFSQVDSSARRAFGGSGLGLAICKGLVEAMGGVIGVRSTEGAGSTFWFEISAPRAPQADAAPALEAEFDLTQRRILLVDDHPMNRELGATVLGILGCDVTLAKDGREALEAVQESDFDAVLMDIHMPVMDGLEATRAIRALAGPAGAIPIIAMSADVMAETLDQCQRAGMTDAVGKPIRIETLQAVLADAIAQRRAEMQGDVAAA
ncbi:ATP-binding protein [Phenylobacterium sp.]|uniref:ATP-binding protein n=1 Tax=Phenylobacterium sp. TaxID=1871053 RepID=UPI002FD93C42